MKDGRSLLSTTKDHNKPALVLPVLRGDGRTSMWRDDARTLATHKSRSPPMVRLITGTKKNKDEGKRKEKKRGREV